MKKRIPLIFTSAVVTLIFFLTQEDFIKEYENAGKLPVRNLFLLFAVLMILFYVFSLLFRFSVFSVMVECLITGSVFFMFGRICFNTVLRRDDYWEITEAIKRGSINFLFHEYRNYNGRYLSWFLKGLHNYLDSLSYIRITLFINLILLFTGFYILLNSQKRAKTRTAAFSVCVICGIVLSSCNVWDLWFWGAGTMIYGIGVSLCILATALFLKASTRWENALTALCILLSCGCSELTTASICAFLAMITILPPLLFGKPWSKKRIILTVEAWVITGIVLLTSGDLSYKTGASGVDLSSFFTLIPDVFRTLCQYTYSKIEWITAFFILFFLWGIEDKTKIADGISILLCIIVLLITAFGTLMIGKITNYTPTRVIAVSVGWITIGVFLTAYSIGQRIQNFRNVSFCFPQMRWASLLICFFCLFRFYHSNIGQVIRLRMAWEDRNTFLSDFHGSMNTVETCAVPVIGGGQREPTEDPDHESNLVIAYYYGLDQVTADHLCFPFEE